MNKFKKMFVVRFIRCLILESSSHPLLNDLNVIANRITTITSQYQVIEKEIQYVKRLLNRQESDDLNQIQESIRGKDDNSMIVSQDMNVYLTELENSRSLVQLLTKEIDTLQNSMGVILDEGAVKIRSINEKFNLSESHAINLLQRQVRELRAVWTREVAANTFLRTLITKTQAERIKIEENVQSRFESLQEEFDELAELFEASRSEINLLKSEISHRDKLLCSINDDAIPPRGEYTRVNVQLQSDLLKRKIDFENIEVKYLEGLEKLNHIENNQKLEASSSKIFDLYNSDPLNIAGVNIQQEFDDLNRKYTEVKNSLDERNSMVIKMQAEYSNAMEQLDRLRSSLSQNDPSLSVNSIDLQVLLKDREAIWRADREGFMKKLDSSQAKYNEAMVQVDELRKMKYQSDMEIQNLLQSKESDWLFEREKLMKQLLLAGEEISRLNQFVSQKQDEIMQLKRKSQVSAENLMPQNGEISHDWVLKEKKWNEERQNFIQQIQVKTEELLVLFSF